MQNSLSKFLTTGQHPASDREKSAMLDLCRNALLSPKTKMQTNRPTIFGMAEEKIIQVASDAPKGKIMQSLVAAHYQEELAKSKPAASRPAPAPAPARRAPAPAPAASKTPRLDAIMAAKAKSKPASKTPLTDALAKLSGRERAEYFKRNRLKIMREQRR